MNTCHSISDLHTQTGSSLFKFLLLLFFLHSFMVLCTANNSDNNQQSLPTHVSPCQLFFTLSFLLRQVGGGGGEKHKVRVGINSPPQLCVSYYLLSHCQFSSSFSMVKLRLSLRLSVFVFVLCTYLSFSFLQLMICVFVHVCLISQFPFPLPLYYLSAAHNSETRYSVFLHLSLSCTHKCLRQTSQY